MTLSTHDSSSGPVLTEAQRRAVLAAAAAEAERHRQLGDAATAWRTRGLRCEVATDGGPCGELAAGGCAHCGVVFCPSHQSYDRSPTFRIMADTCRKCQDAQLQAHEAQRRERAAAEERRRRRRRLVTGLLGAVGVGAGAWLGRPAADDWLASADGLYVRVAQVTVGLTVVAVLFLAGKGPFARRAARVGGVAALLAGIAGFLFLLAAVAIPAWRLQRETGEWTYPGGPLVGAGLWLVGAITVAAAVRRR